MSRHENCEQDSAELRQRRMVPRVAPEGDVAEYSIVNENGKRFYGEYPRVPDYDKNDESSITDALLPKLRSGEANETSWNFDDEQTVTSEAEGKHSFVEDVVISDTKETMFSIALEIFVPFLVAGFGMVGAGLVLDKVQHWKVFTVVTEIFILVPALLGLKGNLEMTLASRLSTQANLGCMDTYQEQWKLASGNMALIQCQAVVVGFLASISAMIMGWIPEGHFNIQHALVLCASSLVTASFASFILGCIMVVVVIMSRKFKVNPDNIATPIAASLGDLTTLSLLAGISTLLYGKLDSPGFAITIIVFSLLLIPLWVTVAKHNRYTHDVLYSGWLPVISAMAISSIGGFILGFTVEKFTGIAVFQPVINGVGGNLVAVQASRISTYLHQRSKLGVLPDDDSSTCKNPISIFFGKSIHSTTARVLLLMVVPGHLVFTYGIRLVDAGHTSVTPVFLSIYCLAALIQVLFLLYFAHIMVHWMWLKHIDPDNSAIPYLTALGDLLGTSLLAIAFAILYRIGDRDLDVGE